jgi:hypothetical protein
MVSHFVGRHRGLFGFRAIEWRKCEAVVGELERLLISPLYSDAQNEY